MKTIRTKKELLYASVMIATLLLLPLFSSPAWAKTDTVKGQADIRGDNVLDAKDRAETDALRNAVEQVAGVLAASESKFLNSTLLKDVIVTQANGYVSSFDILSEQKEDEIYVVEIEAVVSDDTLWNDILAKKILLAQEKYPRVLFLVDEKTIKETEFYPDWSQMPECEVSLIQKFKDAGFKVRDPKILRENIDRSKAIKIIQGDKEAVKALRHQYGAEILVVGDATGKDLGDKLAPPFHTCNAHANLRAIRTDNAEILSTSSQDARQADVDPDAGMNKALSKACGDLAEDLLQGIFKNYHEEIAGQRTIELVLTGVKSYGDIDKFKKIIQEKIRGINSVDQREFTLNTAVFDIQYTQGDGTTLASQIQATKFEPFKVLVTGNSPNRVDAKIVRSGSR
jgi:hypothetical protein